MEAIKEIIKLFENFIKRAVMPSVSFGFIFCVEYLVLKYVYSGEITNLNKLQVLINSFKLNDLTILLSVIILIGLSYLLSILHQLSFDNFIKKNYDGLISSKENDTLNTLRTNVIKKVEKDLTIENITYNDFFLYQIVGRKLAYFSKSSSTSRYVDDTKSMGIFFISFLLTNIFFTSLLFNKLSLIIVIIILVISAIAYFIGFQSIKAKYRTRAIRMYVNYLIGEKSKESTNSTTYPIVG